MATPFWAVRGMAAIAETQTVELDQTSDCYFRATATRYENARYVTKNNTSLV